MAAKNNETKNMKTASKEDRDKALNEALAQIQKQFGKGAVMKRQNEYRSYIYRFDEP